jgi:hypothetical protein
VGPSKLDAATLRTQAKAALTGLGWKPAIAHAAMPDAEGLSGEPESPKSSTAACARAFVATTQRRSFQRSKSETREVLGRFDRIGNRAAEAQEDAAEGCRR